VPSRKNQPRATGAVTAVSVGVDAVAEDLSSKSEHTEVRVARRRAWRLRMLAAIAASYALDTLLLALYAAAGTTSVHVPVLYGLAGALLCVVQLAVYLSRVGESAHDPFLTIWFVVPTAVVELAFVAIAPEVGFVFIIVLFIVYGFGALSLTLRETSILWAVTALSVAAALPSFSGRVAIPVATPAERWITALCFLLTLGRCAMTGVLGSVFRDHLAERSAALRRLTASLEAQVSARTLELAFANEQLEQVVAERTAEIKTLHRVLPICAHCKKIRDDEGAWNDLEVYISAHTDAQFSHGICADCLREHYGEYADEVDLE
jgi:diguanylate cyclase